MKAPEEIFDILLKVSELKMDIETAEKKIELYGKQQYNQGILDATKKEIEPLMVEFAEWTWKNTCKSNVPNTRCKNGLYSSVFTTQQLLEEFINYKNE